MDERTNERMSKRIISGALFLSCIRFYQSRYFTSLNFMNAILCSRNDFRCSDQWFENKRLQIVPSLRIMLYSHKSLQPKAELY